MTVVPVALVAGGSRGLGLEIARQLHRRVHHVALCARDEAALQRAACSVRVRGLKRPEFFPGLGRNGCWVLVVSVGDFDFRGGVVVQGFVQAGCVPPVGPLHRGQFDGLDGLPQVFGMDEFGLVEPVDGFGQGVVVGVSRPRCPRRLLLLR